MSCSRTNEIQGHDQFSRIVEPHILRYKFGWKHACKKNYLKYYGTKNETPATSLELTAKEIGITKGRKRKKISDPGEI